MIWVKHEHHDPKHYLMKIALRRIFVLLTLLSYLEGAPAIYEKYVDEILLMFITEVERDYGFACTASGGSMPYNVEEISVLFRVCEPATIEKARRLEIKLTERLRHIMNTHEKIRPYLKQYPVPSNAADIALSFVREDDSHYHDGSVSMVCRRRNGALVYDTAYLKICPATPTTDETGLITNPGKETITDGYTVLLEESYEDALKKLQVENKI